MWKVNRSIEAIHNKTNQIDSIIAPTLEIQFDTINNQPQQFALTIFSPTFNKLLESEIKERINQAIYRPWQIFPLYNYTKTTNNQIFDDDLDTYLNQNPQMIADLQGTLSPIQWLTKHSQNTTDSIPSLDFFSDVFGCKDLTDLSDPNLCAAKIHLTCIATLHNSDGTKSVKVPFGNTFQFKDFWAMPEENHGITLYQALPNSSNIKTQITNFANILSTLGSTGITVPFDIKEVCKEIDQTLYTRLQISITISIRITSVIYCTRKFELVVGQISSDKPFTTTTKTEDIDWQILNEKTKYSLYGSVFSLDKVANEKLQTLRNQELFLHDYQHYMRQIIENTNTIIDRENKDLHSSLDTSLRAMNDGLFDTDKIVDVYTTIFVPNIMPHVQKYWNDFETRYYDRIKTFMQNVPF
jgi:hypothetical protein